MNLLYRILFALGILLGGGGIAYAATVFNSNQVGATPANTFILQTNGTVSTWVNPATISSVFSFTPTTNFGAATNATGTPIWFTAGIQASTTSHLSQTDFNNTNAPQIGIFDPNTPTAGWIVRNSNGTLYIATSTAYATTSTSHIFTVTQAGRVAIGQGAPNTPSATLQLYEQNGTGASPSQIFGGNANGDTDYWLARITNNDGVNNDSFQIGTSTTPGATSVFTISPKGDVGVGSTSPFAQLSIHANPANYRGNILFAIGSSTATATTTLFSIDNVGSTTISLFGSCSGTNALTTTVSGTIVCGAISGSGGAAFPFTPTTFNTQPANSTSTLIGFTKGLYAQKQVFIDPSAASATSTLASLEINQTPGMMPFYVGSSTSLFEVDGATGFTAIGSTSPFARLSIHANPTQGYANTLFAIGSSTPTATSTLFKIEANGSTTLALASTSVTSQSGFSVTGPGTTTELLGVHCDSGAVCNTGLRISNQTSTIVQLDAAGTGTSAQMNICTRGNINSCINLTTNSTAFSNSSGNTLSMNNSNISYTPPAARTSATPNHIFSYSALTAGTVGVSSPSMTFGSQTAPTVLTHSNGVTPFQADVVYWPFKEANTTYNASNEISRAVGIDIPSPPLTNLAGNVKLPYSVAFHIGSSTTNANFSYTATTTNLIGLEIDTSGWTGAANIYAASTTGRVALYNIGAFVVGDSAVCQRVASGEITVDSGVSSCIVSSKFVKDDQGSDDYQAAFARIQKLRPVLFKYKDSGTEDIGLYAEEVAKVDPRYAQYTLVAKDFNDSSGKLIHHFNAGDPTAINWSAIQTDMLLVLQRQTFGTLAIRSVEENWQDGFIALLLLGFLYQASQIKKLKAKTK